MSAADLARLRGLCAELVKRAESDPRRAAASADAVARILGAEGGSARPRGRRGGRRAAPVFDPFDVLRQDPDALAVRLAGLDLEQLRDMVAHYGMDPRRLVMKWKTPERVAAHIVETVQSRSRKGDAFRSADPTGQMER